MEALNMSVSDTQRPAQHVRQHNSILASAEKRALIWIARRLPAWVSSDHLSALGLASMAAAGLAFAAYRATPWAAAAVVASLTLNWFGDSLDGTVARVRGHQRPRYGFYVDHVIDLAGSTFLLIGLAASGLMSPLLCVSLLATYLLVSAESYLATHSAGVFRMSFLGVGPTELRIILAAGALRAAESPFVQTALGPLRLFDVGGVVAIAGLAFAFVFAALRNTRTLYRAEPLAVATAPARSMPAASLIARAS
jgi:phosphatidylglycerophosphate synthase